MRVELKRWVDVGGPFAGRIRLSPETPEEEAELAEFQAHIAEAGVTSGREAFATTFRGDLHYVERWGGIVQTRARWLDILPWWARRSKKVLPVPVEAGAK